MKALLTIGLLVVSNGFMTLAWYGHLKFKEYPWFSGFSIYKVIIFSWLIAFFEYCVLVPANKIGFVKNGGPFDLWELKVIQEVITLIVFSVFTMLFFKDQPLRSNHLIGFGFLILAVYFIFRK